MRELTATTVDVAKTLTFQADTAQGPNKANIIWTDEVFRANASLTQVDLVLKEANPSLVTLRALTRDVKRSGERLKSLIKGTT